MFFALIENVRSGFNVGSIFRTADGAGIKKLFLTGITGRPPHREIRKAALGAEEHVDWQYHADSLEIIKRLKQDNIRIVVLETAAGSVLYHDTEYNFPMCLVVGNEYEGVSPAVLDEADSIINIPMAGVKVSLNVAVAFGIAAYEIKKQIKDENKRTS